MRWFLLLLPLLVAMPARAALNVFACEPEWGALVTELAGEDAKVFVATTARQDPHRIEARPALIARLRNADLAVCTGAELEIGWMPVLLRQAANGRVQPGTPGWFAAAEQVRLLEVPTRLDRSEGDIHAAGNPHVHTDPRNIRAIAVALAARLRQLDPTQAASYTARERSFLQRWDAAIARWTAKAAPLRGTVIVVHHKNWTYLEDWLGLMEAGTIEPKPGVPPGSAHLASLLDSMRRQGVRFVLYTPYEDPRPAAFVAENSGSVAVMLPYTVGGTDRASDLFALFDDTIDRLAAAGGGRGG